jgi:hypothetical protein
VKNLGWQKMLAATRPTFKVCIFNAQWIKLKRWRKRWSVCRALWVTWWGLIHQEVRKRVRRLNQSITTFLTTSENLHWTGKSFIAKDGGLRCRNRNFRAVKFARKYRCHNRNFRAMKLAAESTQNANLARRFNFVDKNTRKQIASEIGTVRKKYKILILFFSTFFLSILFKKLFYHSCSYIEAKNLRHVSAK